MEKEVQKLKMVCKTESEYNGEWLISVILSEMIDVLEYRDVDGSDAIEYILNHIFDNDEIDDAVIKIFCNNPDITELTIDVNGHSVKIMKIY